MNKTVTLGGGCFWCTEAVYAMIKGVISVTPGYMDGQVENPSYREVCTGTTGHNEVIQIVFDSDQIQLKDIIDIFWTAHDPTTLNRQGADKGTQYRSGIYYHEDGDLEAIMESKEQVGDPLWDQSIVTEIKKATTFYPAEQYHHDYYARNSFAGYCQIVINPKLAKVRKQFADKLK